MNLCAVRLHHYVLTLRSVWRSASGGFTSREGCLLQLACENEGRRLYGYGDYAPFDAIDLPQFNALAHALHGQSVDAALLQLENPADSAAPAIRCAIECALLDLLAQNTRQPLSEYLRGAAAPPDVQVNAALGSLMQLDAATILAACNAGYSILKIKVGCAPPSEEIARLRTLASHLPNGIQLRLDANRAWTFDEARSFLQACRDLPIEQCEEPLRMAPEQPQALLTQLGKLQLDYPLPLALDESWQDDLTDTFFTTLPLQRLVLKPPHLGGLLPALALARRAVAHGVDCIVTSSLDSACGVLAAAHLAAALDGGGRQMTHGLATSHWFDADTGSPPEIEGAKLHLPTTPGLGFRPYPHIGFH